VIRKSAVWSIVLSVLGLFAVLGAARGFDAWMEFLRRNNAITFSLSWTYATLWSFPLISLCLAALLILLFWFTVVQAPRRVWISLLYLLVGAFVVLYPEIYMTPALGPWLPEIRPLEITYTQYLLTAGGFVVITGLSSLILPRKNRNDLPPAEA